MTRERGTLRRTFELGLIGMAVTSPSKGILDVNDKLCEILGYERDELLRKTWPEMTHPDDLAADVAQFSRVLAGEIDGYSLDKRWIRKDGQVIHGSIAVKCQRGKDGAAEYFVALLQDVTERKEATQALHDEQERLRIALQAGMLGAWELDLVTTTFTCSDRCKANFGLSPADEITNERLFDLIHPEDRDHVRERISHALEARVDYQAEYRNVWPDGSVHWILARGRALHESDGTPVRMLGVTLDFTDRKRAEERLKESEKLFRVLTEAVPDFMWITDAEGRCEFLNQRWFDYTGMTREQAVDLCWRAPQHPDDVDRYFAAWQQANETGTTLEAELRYRRADGVCRWFLCRALPFRDAAGVITNWYGTTSDIHDKKMAEEASHQARDELEQRVRERTRELTVLNEALRAEVTARKRVEEDGLRMATLVENSTDFIGFTSLEHQAMLVNPAGQRMVGLDGAEHVYRTHILDYVMERERERFQEQILPLVMRKGRWEGEMAFRHFKTGAAIPMLQHIFVCQGTGK